MKLNTRKFIQILVALAAISLVLGNVSSANAAVKKTITCYKGTVEKKVTAVAPKCPTGYTTTKPAAKPAATTGTKAGSVAFQGTFKGKISILFGDGNLIQVTKLTVPGQATSVD